MKTVNHHNRRFLGIAEIGARLHDRLEGVGDMAWKVERILDIGWLRFHTEEVLQRWGISDIFLPHWWELLVRHNEYKTDELIRLILSARWGLLLFERALIQAYNDLMLWSPRVSINIFIEDLQNPLFRHTLERIAMGFREEDRSRITIEINEKPCNLNENFEMNLLWLHERGYRIVLDDVSITQWNPKESITRKILMASRILRYSSGIWRVIDGVKIDHYDSKDLMEHPHTRGRLDIIPRSLTITMEWMTKREKPYMIPYRTTHIQIYGETSWI